MFGFLPLQGLRASRFTPPAPATAKAPPAPPANDVDTSDRRTPDPATAREVFGHYAEADLLCGGWSDAMARLTAASALALRMPADRAGAIEELGRVSAILGALRSEVVVPGDGLKRETAELTIGAAQLEVDVIRGKLKLARDDPRPFTPGWDLAFHALEMAREPAEVAAGERKVEDSPLFSAIDKASKIGRIAGISVAAAPLVIPLLAMAAEAALPLLVEELGTATFAARSALGWILSNPVAALTMAESAGWIGLQIIDAGGVGPYLQSLQTPDGRLDAAQQLFFGVAHFQIARTNEAAQAQAPAPQRGTVATPEGGYTELHNHVMGVPSVKYFADVVAGGDQDLLFQRMRDKFVANPAMQRSMRATWATIQRTDAELAKMAQSGASPPERAELLDGALADILAATDSSPFPNSYPPRNMLARDYVDPGGGPLENFLTDVHGMLADEEIGYSEQSTGLGNLEEAFPEETAQAAQTRAQRRGKRTDIRFLGMLKTQLLTAEPTDDPKILADALAQARTALSRPSAMGVDFGGPEAKEFTAQGMKNFRATYAMVKEEAAERGRPLVLRPHVGEGFNEDGPGSKGHVAKARANIEKLLTELEDMDYNPEKAVRDGVIIRFGHATHATPDQIQRMKACGVILEANIGSNLATGIIESTDEHPLLYALYYEEPTILSTDGQGVMQTSIMKEYMTAYDMIDEFRAGRSTIVIDGKVVLYEQLSLEEQARFDIQHLYDWAAKYKRGVVAGDAMDRARGASNARP